MAEHDTVYPDGYNLSQDDDDLNYKIFSNLAATNTLVALLEHYGKIMLPRKNLIELAAIEQVWPNDFIYRHGATMLVTYNPITDEMGFELRYKMDEDDPIDIVGYMCARNQTKVGDIDHDSPIYRD